jgi:hypothetical protein
VRCPSEDLAGHAHPYPLFAPFAMFNVEPPALTTVCHTVQSLNLAQQQMKRIARGSNQYPLTMLEISDQVRPVSTRTRASNPARGPNEDARSDVRRSNKKALHCEQP